LEGDRQSFQDRVLVIRRESVSDLFPQHQGKKASEEMKKYLEPTPSVQSDHPEIQAKVKEIIFPNDTVVVKTRKLVEWVHENLQKRPVLSVPNALEILRNRVGDCNEHANAFDGPRTGGRHPGQMEAGSSTREEGFTITHGMSFILVRGLPQMLRWDSSLRM